MPARIALVNPPPYGIQEPYYDTPPFTRLGLACLAAYLRKYGYDEVCIIDAKYERIGYDEIDDRLLKFKPDIVGHTAFTNEIVQAAHVARNVRKLSSKLQKPITNIIGGVHLSALPEATLEEFQEFDVGVVGEGEETLLELTETLAQSADPEKYAQIRGLVYRKGGRIVRTLERPRIADQTTLPTPAWDLLPPSPEYLIMTARGCPYACTFCMNPNGRVVRKRDISQVLEEVRWVMEKGEGKHVYFCDEIMTIDKERTHQLLDGLIEIGFGSRYTFSGQTHVNCVDEALLKKMKRAGVKLLGFGIESADDNTLKTMGKGTNLKRIQTAITQARQTGVDLETYFILGQPDETVRSAWQSVWFAARINPKLPIFGIMVPYPGTKIWEWAKRNERGYRLKSQNWNDFNKQLGNALELEHISRRQLELLQFLGYLLVFIVNFRLRELAYFIWTYRREGILLFKKLCKSFTLPSLKRPPFLAIPQRAS